MEGSGNKWDNYVILGVSGNEGDRINTGAFVGEGGGRQWLFKKQSRLRCTRCNLELTIYFGEVDFGVGGVIPIIPNRRWKRYRKRRKH